MEKKIKYAAFSDIELFNDSILLRKGAYHEFTLDHLEFINIEEYNNGRKDLYTLNLLKIKTF